MKWKIFAHRVKTCAGAMSAGTPKGRETGLGGSRNMMSLGFRQLAILDLARSAGQLRVEDLAAHFQVTLQTVRRDLNDLAEAGHLSRVH